jgi:rare lipoprotein A
MVEASTPPHNVKPAANRARGSHGPTTGIASWYGGRHQGRTMADGHLFDRFKLTAASRTLAFGSRVRVENVVDGSTVVVTITDRGPWIASRLIDLSEAAAHILGCLETCTVTLTPVT